MTDNTIVLVKKHCVDMFKENETRLFSPQHIVNMHGVTAPEEIDTVCNAFAFLAALGYFKLRADVFDEDGEEIYGGEPHRWDPYWENSLRNKSGDDIDFNDCFVQVYFVMTEKFEKEIEE